MSTTATPAMVILGFIVDAARIPALTRDFLALKRQYFPGRFKTGPALNHILVEIKGSEILQMTRDDSRNKRRQAQFFRRDLLGLVEAWMHSRRQGMDQRGTSIHESYRQLLLRDPRRRHSLQSGASSPR